MLNNPQAYKQTYTAFLMLFSIHLCMLMTLQRGYDVIEDGGILFLSFMFSKDTFLLLPRVHQTVKLEYGIILVVFASDLVLLNVPQFSAKDS